MVERGKTLVEEFFLMSGICCSSCCTRGTDVVREPDHSCRTHSGSCSDDLDHGRLDHGSAVSGSADLWGLEHDLWRTHLDQARCLTLRLRTVIDLVIVGESELVKYRGIGWPHSTQKHSHFYFTCWVLLLCCCEEKFKLPLPVFPCLTHILCFRWPRAKSRWWLEIMLHVLNPHLAYTAWSFTQKSVLEMPYTFVVNILYSDTMLCLHITSTCEVTESKREPRVLHLGRISASIEKGEICCLRLDNYDACNLYSYM